MSSFEAGKEHTIELECDLWPEISYVKQASGENDGYKKLKISAVKPTIDMDKYNSVKQNILERYKSLEDTGVEHASEAGDVVVVNMKVSNHSVGLCIYVLYVCKCVCINMYVYIFACMICACMSARGL